MFSIVSAEKLDSLEKASGRFADKGVPRSFQDHCQLVTASEIMIYPRMFHLGAARRQTVSLPLVGILDRRQASDRR